MRSKQTKGRLLVFSRKVDTSVRMGAGNVKERSRRENDFLEVEVEVGKGRKKWERTRSKRKRLKPL